MARFQNYLWRSIPFLGQLMAAFLLVGSGSCQAQQIVVISGLGRTNSQQSGKQLNPGDLIGANDAIRFENPGARLIAWRQGTGLISIEPKKVAGQKWELQGSAGEMSKEMTAGFSPKYKETCGSIEEVAAHFVGRRYLLFGKSWVLVDSNRIHLDGDTVFFFKFSHSQINAAVNEKIAWSADSLLIDPALFLDMNGVPVPAESARDFRLFFANASTKAWRQLGKFEFIYANEPAIKKELTLLSKLLERDEIRGEEALNVVLDYLSLAHGDADGWNLLPWLKENLPALFHAAD